MKTVRNLSQLIMAVRGGFEPPIHFRIYTLSRRAPSTTRTSHRITKKYLKDSGTIPIFTGLSKHFIYKIN